jgi:transposase
MSTYGGRPKSATFSSRRIQGIAGLGIRAWICSECGAVHDRNVNAAKNILAAGRRRLAEGIPALFSAREDVKYQLIYLRDPEGSSIRSGVVAV